MRPGFKLQTNVIWYGMFYFVFEAFQNMAYFKVFLSHSLLLILLKNLLRDGGYKNGARKVWRTPGDGVIQDSVDLVKDFEVCPENTGKPLDGFKQDVTR